MKILIVSDTHRQNANYFEILRRIQPLDMVIHCGDAEGSEYAITEAADCPVKIVLGNNDFFSQLPKELEFKIGSLNVLVTHGHNYYVSAGLGVLKKEAKARGIDVVFFGHTHRPVIDQTEEGLTLVNPGSLSYPRQEGRKPSYAIMEIDRYGIPHYTIAYME